MVKVPKNATAQQIRDAITGLYAIQSYMMVETMKRAETIQKLEHEIQQLEAMLEPKPANASAH
jgi:hypothetical protein